MNAPEVWAIILAAGAGSRLRDACGMAKQYICFHGKPLYWHSARAFSHYPPISGIVFVFPPEDCERERRRIAGLAHELGLPWDIVAGGPERSVSGRNGLARVPRTCKKVLIHDAARPFVTPALIQRVLKGLDGTLAGVVPAIAVTDTIKMANAENPDLVECTLPRARLRAIQTPQAFDAETLRQAHKYGEDNEIMATDDASLLEAMGARVGMVPGEPVNIKITSPEDLHCLKDGHSDYPCSGFGYDAHRYGGNRPLKLGGITIPCDLAVHAHSDGDVALHALIDAILSCACLGDIGCHFPDKDPAFDGISSAILLDDALGMARDVGVRILQADITIVAQKPRLEAWKSHICANLARLLNLPPERINFKATTEEKMGFTGRVEGIKAYALVSAIKEG